ncbi:metallophosphoesterase [Peptococcaceae bacterium]|nr:metallophosphoesterase [Peptococcaceae bacterium]
MVKFKMRIGIISDTHGNLNIAKAAISKMGSIDVLLHAGDHYKDAVALEKEISEVDIYAVVGNCDFEVFKPKDLFLEIAGKKIWLTHGHKYGVKESDDYLASLAIEKNIDIVVYGHTHIAVSKFIENKLIFNPGSTTRPRGSKPATYGIIEIKDGKIYPEILEI